MRIRLAKILLAIMVISGIVLPIHAYAHEIAETQNNHSFEKDAIDTEYESDSNACDHCCHLSSHSVGLLQKNPSITSKQIKGTFSFRMKIYSSYKYPPPYHPPIT